MEENGKDKIWIFILFPAVTMLLAWGLRGSIGGGPFGAMIPGAMIAISLCILLKIPVGMASIIAVFGVAAVGLGGEMTYGQTIGFLRNPDTMWWGTLGLTVKGAIWGLLGGIFLTMGFLYNQLTAKKIFVSLLLLMAGMLAGFKLINQPMILYFSDPAKPRSESWGALLIGAIAILAYLKVNTNAASFRLISRFAILGLIGGGIGFGTGGFWIVLGSRLNEVVFKEWWKAMEFTFGFIMGGFFGLATWFNRSELISAMKGKAEVKAEVEQFNGVLIKEILVTIVTGFLIFWAFSSWLDPIVDAGSSVKGFTLPGLRDIAIIFSNYSFFCLIMIVAVIYFPYSAWQIAVTLTFCHTVIDLFQDIYPDTADHSMLFVRLPWVLVISLIVGSLAAWFKRRGNVILKMFLLLVWSTVFIAFLRYLIQPEVLDISGLSFSELVLQRYFVLLVFLASAVMATIMSISKTRHIL